MITKRYAIMPAGPTYEPIVAGAVKMPAPIIAFMPMMVAVTTPILEGVACAIKYPYRGCRLNK
jgi:hypothetical protein